MAQAAAYSVQAPTSRVVVGPHNLLNYNNLVLNDRRELECYWIDDFVGFEDADLRIVDEDNTQEDGSQPGPGFYGARVMTMTGTIMAGSYPKVLDMTAALQDALLDLVERPLKIKVLPGGPFVQPDVEINARKADKLLISKQIQPADLNGTFKRGFTLALKATDPTYKSSQLHQVQVAPSAIVETGRKYDRTYDLGYAELMDSFGNLVAATGANQFTVINAGNWYALPTITFTGFFNDVRLKNEMNGHVLRLQRPIAAGDVVIVNTLTGEVTNQYGQNQSDYFDTSSDWLRLVGTRKSANGSNVLSIATSNFDASASIAMSWRDTHM